VIVVKDLWVELGEFTLKNITFSVEKGEYLVIMGPSGVGKTVLLHTIVGMIRPSRGKIIIDGVDVTNKPPEERGIALVPQNYALFPHMTVFDNIAYGLRAKKLPRSEIVSRVRSVANLLNIEHILSKKPSQISGGEQQRVALARALVIEPKVLLLDEPTASLDPSLRTRARELIKELHKELRFTAIHVTHNMIEAIELGHRIAYIEGGEIKAIGKPEEVLKLPELRIYIDDIRRWIDIAKKLRLIM